MWANLLMASRSPFPAALTRLACYPASTTTMPIADAPPWDGLAPPAFEIGLTEEPASTSCPERRTTKLQLRSHARILVSAVAGVLEALGIELVGMHAPASGSTGPMQHEASFVLSGHLEPNAMQSLLPALRQALEGSASTPLVLAASMAWLDRASARSGRSMGWLRVRTS